MVVMLNLDHIITSLFPGVLFLSIFYSFYLKLLCCTEKLRSSVTLPGAHQLDMHHFLRLSCSVGRLSRLLFLDNRRYTIVPKIPFPSGILPEFNFSD